MKESPQLEALNLQEVSRCKEVREIHEEVIRLLEHRSEEHTSELQSP